MRRVLRTKRYFKSLSSLPAKARDEVEAAVDRLEGDWKGLDFAPLQGMKPWWRLSAGQYRVFCRIASKEESAPSGRGIILVQVQEIMADEVIRRSTTTYRKRN